jgi:hypothetical protein
MAKSRGTIEQHVLRAQSGLLDLAVLARVARMDGHPSMAKHSAGRVLQCRQESTAAVRYVKMERSLTYCSSRASRALPAHLAQRERAVSVVQGNVRTSTRQLVSCAPHLQTMRTAAKERSAYYAIQDVKRTFVDLTELHCYRKHLNVTTAQTQCCLAAIWSALPAGHVRPALLELRQMMIIHNVRYVQLDMPERPARARSAHLVRNQTLRTPRVKRAQLDSLESMVCAVSAQLVHSRLRRSDTVYRARGQKPARMPVITGPAQCALTERLPMKLALHAWNASQGSLGLSDYATHAHLAHANLSVVPHARRVRWVARAPRASVMRVPTARSRPSFGTNASVASMDTQDDRDSARSVKVDAPRIWTALNVCTVSLGMPDRAASALNAHLERSPTQTARLAHHANR